MKITDIISYPTWVGHRNQLIVKVETDEGITGWGEPVIEGRAQTVEAAVHELSEQVKVLSQRLPSAH